MFCSNCGAKAAGKFCSECGQKLSGDAKTDIKGNKSQKNDISDQNFFGFDFGEVNKSLADALSMQKAYDETGKISDKMIEDLKSGFGLGNILKDIQSASERQTAQLKEQRAVLKKARIDIGKGICPDCGQSFKKRQTSCKNCGASVLIESYEEY